MPRRRDADRARRRPHDRARRAARARRPCTARSRWCSSTPTATPNDSYYGNGSSTAPRSGARWRRACAPEQSVMAGMRGPLYDPDEWDRPRTELGFDVIPCEELRDMAPGDLAGGCGPGRRRACVPAVRHRRDRPVPRSGHGHAGGRRIAAVPGTPIRARRSRGCRSWATTWSRCRRSSTVQAGPRHSRCKCVIEFLGLDLLRNQ